MLTLTLQTSDRNCETAIWDQHQCLTKIDFESFSKTYVPDSGSPGSGIQPGGSTLLLPMVQRCLQKTEAKMADLGLIAVTHGPGMFTPLRVGVVAAKTMAYVNSTPLIGVNVLQAIALDVAARHQLDENCEIESVVNAQRKQLFAARFKVTAQRQVAPLGDSRLLDAQRWAETLPRDTVTSGPGLRILSPSIIEGLRDRTLPASPQPSPAQSPPSIVVDDQDHWRCKSSAVAAIALRRFAEDDVDDPWTLSPIYFRPSAAEEVRKARNKS